MRTKYVKIKKSHTLTKILAVCLCLIIVGTAAIFGINSHIKRSTQSNIITANQAQELSDVDCIVVLGTFVKGDGDPGLMLTDRLERAIELYNLKAGPKLLMSGDHGRKEYNEVGSMKDYAISKGIKSEDVFMDHAGFSTYESMYRAKEIFKADKIIIVTQQYHLSRALYIAESLGIEAYGVPSDLNTYAGQNTREIREILARCKDFAASVFKPKPTYLGEAIPVSGNGNLTND